MEFAALKWWHWMLIALIVGIAIGKLRESAQSEIRGNYIEGFGYFLGNQKIFEDGLVSEINGKRRFRGITVYARRIDDGHGERKPVYLVKGMYYGGPAQVMEGRRQGGWQPTCFVARAPYDPLIDLTTFNKPGGRDWSKVYRDAGLQPTVLDFLSVMHAAAGVQYSYAWWDQYPVLTSVIASIVVIGLCWPVVINLLAFRRVVRPPEAKAMSLWRVRNRRTRPVANVGDWPAEAMAAGGKAAAEVAIVSETPPAAGPPSRDVSSTPLDELPTATLPDKDFGAREEDYYPTECHVPRRDNH